jgi:limonene-1,2-epoxide hydrolase
MTFRHPKLRVLIFILLLVTTQTETVMANETPLQIVTAFMNEFEKMDFDAGVTYVADDIEYINSPGTVVRGPSGVRAVLEPFFVPIEENEFIILRQVTEGNVVVLERLDRHRVPQGWFELPVTGVFEVNNGKITYWREYFDLETVRVAMEQLMGGQE